MKILQELQNEALQYETRRHFLKQCTTGLGMMALGSFLQSCGLGGSETATNEQVGNPLFPKIPQFPARAKSIIYIHMAGSPSQLELFDYKPELQKMNGQKCPQSFLEGKKFAFIRGVPSMLGPQANFKQNGQSGAWLN